MASINGVIAGFDANTKSNIAIYWGQNSYGQGSGDLAQQRLSYYCANTDIDVIPLAFLTVINGVGGQPEINFANQGNGCSTFNGTALLDCPNIAEDIATCQNTYSKTVLLSVGGATYSEGGFTSSSAAIAAADLIWATFGPQQSDSNAFRPFGSSSVDGFDFDFEAGVSNMVPFANQLRSLMDAATASSGKMYLLTAAPQCPYPDYADNDMLNGAVSFDAIFVQFYNNYCGVSSYVAGSSTQNNFNFDTWDNWAKTVSKNTNVKVLLGVPANTGAGAGYVSANTLNSVISYCTQFSSFGGVMMWDASQAWANSGFVGGVSGDLSAATKRAMRRGWRSVTALV
ncbi:glycoside hydrolase family 18 protein [Cenococcum geophilum 1.58]|uniref:glycoside hydrolase family 18 protein n=1 Tax=Cenococcum geophilum 1.58 TaxID=794803 RepID=UPI00358F29D3|nr:glycoside hydrolase family 18 protein [Cenococcum geophilum 1.58]